MEIGIEWFSLQFGYKLNTTYSINKSITRSIIKRIETMINSSTKREEIEANGSPESMLFWLLPCPHFTTIKRTFTTCVKRFLRWFEIFTKVTSIRGTEASSLTTFSFCVTFFPSNFSSNHYSLIFIMSSHSKS